MSPPMNVSGAPTRAKRRGVTRPELQVRMTFEPVNAREIALSRRAALPCGCVGVVLGRDGEDEVQFGIDQPSPECQEHTAEGIALVNAFANVTPIDVKWWDPTAG